jgi:hypothetical protein
MFQVITLEVYDECMSQWGTLGEAVANYTNLVTDHALEPLDDVRVFRCATTGELVALQIQEVSDDSR